jgi:cytochrome c5
MKKTGCVNLGCLIIGSWLMFLSSSHATDTEGTIGYAQERYKPAPVYNGPVRSGKQVYDYACKTCHDRTTQGAPLPNDEIEWGMRARKGMKVLLQHVKEGYKGLMPEKGGCRNCSDEELLAGVLYILETSGVEPIYLGKTQTVD